MTKAWTTIGACHRSGHRCPKSVGNAHQRNSDDAMRNHFWCNETTTRVKLTISTILKRQGKYEQSYR
eukprot:1118062-Amphidinium_carterae.1